MEKPSGYIAVSVGSPDQIDAKFRQSRDVAFEIARIGAEILGRRELRGIDEDRHDNGAGALSGVPNQ